MSNLADTLTQMGEYAKAEKLLTQARDIQRRVLGPDSPDTTLSTYNLGCVLAHQDKHDEALSALRDALDHGLSGWVALDMAMDPDLKSLHGDPRFDALVARAKARVAATQ
jgi:predicted negative regulator of RcsB-dependent stress response